MKHSIIYSKGNRQWQGIPGIEIAPNGRLWAVFYSGGPKEPHRDNFILVCSNSDGGNTWSKPKVIVDPGTSPRAYDPTLWMDPKKRLWLIYNQTNLKKLKGDIRYISTKNPR